jgi:N-acetylmuramate 1-kinase
MPFHYFTLLYIVVLKEFQINPENMQASDYRTNAILNWLKNDLQLEIQDFVEISCDASFRRYFRVIHQQRQYVVMDAPPEQENILSFIKVNQLFRQAHLKVPEIFQQNLTHGFLLLEDFGDYCFLDKINHNNAASYYQPAMDSLFNLQKNIDIATCNLPFYDESLLNRELEIFVEWFLHKFSNISFSDQDQKTITLTWSMLIQSALDQPRVCVHRDYHSRNLMLLNKPPSEPGIIDFQDAVIGPITYDLVSLLRDCYIAWPESLVLQWMSDYYKRLCNAGMLSDNKTQFKRWFDFMGLQRHLKAIGIFARLHIRDNKPGYLQDIPRTMNYVTTICSQYPELSAFNEFLQARIPPIDTSI